MGQALRTYLGKLLHPLCVRSVFPAVWDISLSKDNLCPSDGCGRGDLGPFLWLGAAMTGEVGFSARMTLSTVWLLGLAWGLGLLD